jgi:hypothetical protein
MPSYVMSVRKESRGQFTAESATLIWLFRRKDPAQPCHSFQDWFDKVTNGISGQRQREKRGDLLFSVMDTT